MEERPDVVIPYRFCGALCGHPHQPASKENPFDTGWERLTLNFRSSDWFGGPVNAWLKARCLELGIPWLEFAPRSRVSPELATLFGARAAPVPDEEQRLTLGPWAALAPGGSIFDDAHCSTPWCANHDPLLGLFSEQLDIVLHAPVELVEEVLSSLYDWNHGIGEVERKGH
jgi:hypothetical protein